MEVGLYNIQVPDIDGKGPYNENLSFRKPPTSEDIDVILMKIRPSREYSVLAEKKITFIRWLEPHEY